VTSERKICANRANARFSTGPRSETGRRHSSQNARRHGLSSFSIAKLDRSRIERLTHKFAGPTNNPYVLTAAERLAESQLELERIRTTRQSVLRKTESSLSALNLPEQIDQLLDAIMRFDRYERRANARRRKAIKAFDDARTTQLTLTSNWQNEAKTPKKTVSSSNRVRS
jgi:hypothetical protein